MVETCPVCGEQCVEMSSWYESKADDADEFRTIVHEKDNIIVTESCTETR